MMNNIDYIKSIISIFHLDDKNPKLWNVDTDYLGTIKRLVKKMKSNRIKEINSFKTKKVGEKFAIVINDIIVTPSNKAMYLSKSTIRQYLQFFSSFSWIIFNDNKSDWLKQEEYEFETNISFNILLSGEINFNELLIELIINGSISLSVHKKNLAFSLFLYWCYNHSFDYFKNVEFQLEKNRKKKGVLKFILSNSEEAKSYFLHQQKKKGGMSNTYYHSYEEYLKNLDFSETLKYIYTTIISRYFYLFKDSGGLKLDIKKNNINFNEIMNQINSSRNQLREKIISQRIKNKQYHSDIESIGDSNIIPIKEMPLVALEAAHIYEIKKIKSNICFNNSSYDNEFDLNACSDPNNGLMLPQIYHLYFDRGVIKINQSGESIFLEEYKEDLERCNIWPFRIKKEYFNDHMKKYLIKRYN